ncbi:MAG: DNA repair protein RadA, partial [Deltaproteobacteria bacterium]
MANKAKKVFVCTNCGATSPKWVGKCPACEEWNTYQEEVIVRETPAARRAQAWADPDDRNRTSQPVSIEAIQAGARRRLVTPDEELNRVLGGGIVPGSLVLIGGQPGIGKSTLMLQVAMALPA